MPRSLTRILLLSATVGASSLFYGINPANSQEMAKVETKQEQTQKYGKHDHTRKYYESNFSGDNLDSLEQEVDSHPTFLGKIRLSDVYHEIKQVEKAFSSAKQAIALNPKDWEGYQNAGSALVELNRLDEARKYLANALKLSPVYPEMVYTSLGELENRRGNLWVSIEWFDKALSINPSFQPARQYRQNVMAKFSH